MTEEEKAIIMYRLHGCAKQYAISKVVEQRWDLETMYHTEFTTVLELAAELGVVKFGDGENILAEVVAAYQKEQEKKEAST